MSKITPAAAAELEEFFKNIADTIRLKRKTTASFRAENFPSEILKIIGEGGGSTDFFYNKIIDFNDLDFNINISNLNLNKENSVKNIDFNDYNFIIKIIEREEI